ncbi:MAG: metallophosphoesterase [Candidatus Pacebacteria bacterium]|nr:metallophosphoesterase [Candidatus Paceibacterota bacterium]
MNHQRTATIALLADPHYGVQLPIAERRGEIADILLKRAVSRLNRLIRPDATLVLGDVLDNGAATDARERLTSMRDILDRLDAPYIAIPGNHDSDPEAFYRVFTRPELFEDINGIRFVPFVDPEEPGFNARRTKADIDRFRAARAGYEGPIVALQHTCLFPPGSTEAPYNYTNAPEIIATMKEENVMLSVSGHYHRGAETVRDGDVTFVHAPALCETPFPFLVVTLREGMVTVERHELAMPSALGLFDGHVHTHLAYCNDNMTVEQAIDLAGAFGLSGVAFTEHSGHLYFDRERYWSGSWFEEGIRAARPADSRMANYLAMKQANENERVRFGLEADCDRQGNPVLACVDRTRFDYRIGAIHHFPPLGTKTPPDRTANDTFLGLVEKMLASGIDVLAHPFRIYRRNGWAAPHELFRPTAELLRKYQVAAEINFHTNEPPVEFVRTCLELGVKFSFGSDAHALYEIGDFAYQMALLKEAGFDGDPADVVITRP